MLSFLILLVPLIAVQIRPALVFSVNKVSSFEVTPQRVSDPFVVTP
jgi:hypothetical protein